jgi:hypothetical protein
LTYFCRIVSTVVVQAPCLNNPRARYPRSRQDAGATVAANYGIAAVASFEYALSMLLASTAVVT